MENEEFRKRVDAEIERVRKALSAGDRTKGVWLTSHNSVYDLNSKSMRFVFEEEYDRPVRF